MDGMMPELHAPAPPQPQTSAQYFFTPLMISMACMFATFFAIVTYHFLIVNFCVGRRHSQAVADLLARRRSAAVWDRDSPVGVEEKVLRRIPILSYTVNPKLGSSGFRSDGECVVCLGEMEEGAAVRVLPNCRHVFHVACIDRWFLAHSSCPVCRSPVVPPPDHQVECLPTTEPASGHGGRQLRRLSSAGTGLLRHAVSIVFPMEVENKVPRGERLRRSVSMDVVINVSTVGSSSSNNVVASASSDLESGGSRSNNARNSNMDASLSSSKVMRIRSFTQLRIHDVEAAAVTVV